MADIDCVKVALRVRPLVDSERERGCQRAVERPSSGIPQVIVNRTDAYTFNYVFDENDTQKIIFESCVSSMLKKLLNGFNATILAYGQTGSGKTFTMGTAFNGHMDEDAGVIPRAMYALFEEMEAQNDLVNFEVKCSFMELYREHLFDLLSLSSREDSIVDLRENKTGVIIPGLTERVVSSAQEVTDQLLRGSAGRAVAATAMNQQSSRSHAIFTLTILATKKSDTTFVTTSKFHLVDLAGSERCTKTQTTGHRFKEGVTINKGLLALGNVISALGSSQASSFVPYRESKLTRLLQDSLGGNSITLMIACVSPADYNVSETLGTLRYANRARAIKNKPIVNEDPHAAEISRLKDIIQKLRVEMGGAGLLNTTLTATTAASAEMQAQVKDLQAKNRNLQMQLQQALHDSAENQMRAHIAEAAHEKLKTHTNTLKEIVSRMTQSLTAMPSANSELTTVEELTQLLENIGEDHERTESAIQAHKKEFRDICGQNIDGYCESGHTDSELDSNDEVQEMLQPHTESHTKKQINFNTELRIISRELDLKEELHQRVCTNFNKMYAVDDDIEAKVKDCEQKIEDLEQEKVELEEKLRHVKENASAKLAEERRKRLQTLEQEITDMKRKILQQGNLLKVREKETQKIKNLSSEIRQMKESKVKLIRTMRQESESFRQWKMVREKELMQLKTKDRKRQNEMARKEALYTKQHNVLKRKFEEATAINKRLKEAQERQVAAHAMRQKNSKGAVAAKSETMAWVDKELELLLSLIDAEHSLVQLMEDRSVISGRINDLKSQINQITQQDIGTASPGSDIDAASADLQTEKLAALEDELEMRNAQIADLQQKVCAADVDVRISSLSEGLQNVNELRATVLHLLKTITDMHRLHAQQILEQKLCVEEQRTQVTDAEVRYETIAKRMRLAELKQREVIAENERACEEKISLLLQGQKKHRRNVDKQSASFETSTAEKEEANVTDDPDSEVVDFTDHSDDPDWIQTPAPRRRRRVIRSGDGRKRNAGERVADDTNITATEGAEGTESTTFHDDSLPESTTSGLTQLSDSAAESYKTSEHKLQQSKRCKCRNNCSSKRCGCNSRNATCSLKCRCPPSCLNGKQRASDDSLAEDDDIAKEPEPTVPDSNAEEDGKENSIPTDQRNDTNYFVKPSTNNSEISPKIARLSVLNFDTPSIKRKFFN